MHLRRRLRVTPRRDPALAMRIGRDAGTHVIGLFGELDLATVGDFERALADVEASHVAEIVVDLSGLQFIDSTGIRVLAEAARRSRTDGRRLTLLRGPEPVHLVFELCGMADVLPFAD